MNNFLWWIRYGIWTWLSDRPRKTKSFLQRGWRGWADEDTWDFDYYLTNVIIGGLKHLKKYQNILPTWEEGKSEIKAQKEWNEIFEKIIIGFECARLLINELGLDHNEKIEAERLKNEGFDLFKRYFNCFWD